HEAWLRLAGEKTKEWANRAQFFSAAAEAMRRTLVERARKHLALQRGGGASHEDFEESRFIAEFPSDELLAIHEALEGLAAEDPSAAELVKQTSVRGRSRIRECLGNGVMAAPDQSSFPGGSSSSGNCRDLS